eukprot:g1723.t1
MSADEERRKAEKPVCSDDEARSLAGSLFGMTDITSIKELESYDDRNFRVKGRLPSDKEERTYTLKVHNGVESDNAAVLEAQDTAMQFLHERGISVPHPVCPTKTTEELFVAGGGDASKRTKRPIVVRLLSWVDGDTMNNTGPSRSCPHCSTRCLACET